MAAKLTKLQRLERELQNVVKKLGDYKQKVVEYEDKREKLQEQIKKEKNDLILNLVEAKGYDNVDLGKIIEYYQQNHKVETDGGNRENEE